MSAQDKETSYYPCMNNFRHLQCSSRDDELVFAHLLTLSGQLYAAKDVHIEQAGLLFANSMAAHTKRTEDPNLGSVFETVSSTPVPFTVQQTDDAVWNGLFKGEFKDRPVLSQTQVRGILDNVSHVCQSNESIVTFRIASSRKKDFRRTSS